MDMILKNEINTNLKSNITISQMTISDLLSIKNILVSDFDDFWKYDILSDELLSSNSKYLVAKFKNEVIGFAGIKTILDEAELMNIVVKKNFRGKGISNCLLDNIFLLCKKNEILRLNLEVNAKNSIAINLYKKYNLKQVGYRKKYYNGIDDAILMSINFSNKQ